MLGGVLGSSGAKARAREGTHGLVSRVGKSVVAEKVFREVG